MNKNLARFFFVGAAAIVVSGNPAAHAAILTGIPMQGGMVMPMISYHAADGRLHVMLESNLVELIPLLVSHPGDRFDPEDPWYDSLDPSGQGLAFSRRYGFVIDGMTDPLPSGTQIWIRKLSGSPEVSAYRNALGTWEPVFGTDGTANALYWDAFMFHPTFTALPGTNTYTATFQAYLFDTNTLAEVPDSSSAPFVFNWVAVPDGRPTLSIAQDGTVRWLGSATNWLLESAEAPHATAWTLVTNTPVLIDGAAAVAIEPNDAQRFFRMRLSTP